MENKHGKDENVSIYDIPESIFESWWKKELYDCFNSKIKTYVN